MFECKLKNGSRYIMTGVTSVDNDGEMLKIITKTFTHFLPTKHLESYTISF